MRSATGRAYPKIRRLSALAVFLCTTAVIAFTCSPVSAQDPVLLGQIPVYIRVSGSATYDKQWHDKVTGCVKRIGGVEVVDSPAAAVYQLDISIADISEHNPGMPVLMITVVTLKTYPRLPFTEFVISRWGRVGPLGLLKAFVKKEHLASLSTRRIYTTSMKRITQTCEQISAEFQAVHIKDDYIATKWLTALARQAATTASLALKEVRDATEPRGSAPREAVKE